MVLTMRRQRIYIDTSVIGGCFDDEFAPWSNGLMKDFHAGLFVPVVSEVVTAEIEDGAPERIQRIYRELLATSPEQVSVNDQVTELADRYLERQILTRKYYDDGLHIALATVHEVDMVVSWNFRHIVHFDKIRRFNAVNLELGYRTIEIYSPREVTSHGREDV